MTDKYITIKWEFNYPCSDLHLSGEIENVDKDADELAIKELIAQDLGWSLITDNFECIREDDNEKSYQI